METPLIDNEAKENAGLFDLGIDLLWEYGEDNDGWYVGPHGEQRAWAASEQDAAMIVDCVNSFKKDKL
jgi:hypothetical protein